MSTARLLVRATVFVDDVIKELAAVDADGGAADCSSSIHAERLVRELLEVHADRLAQWPPDIRRVALALRNPRVEDFCVVYEFRGIPVESVTDTYASGGYIGSGIDCGPVYTLPLADLEPVDRATIPRATPQSTPRRPYPHNKADAEAVDLLGLALADDVRATLGGACRLSRAPALAPLGAMAATISGVATATALKKHLDSVAVIGAIAAIVPEEHRHTAERIVFADHDEHISFDMRDAPDRFIQHRARGLALFCRDDAGNVVWNDPALVQHPRILHCLNHEPL